MAFNVDTTIGELPPAAHVRVQEEISQMKIANRCAELGGQASISSIREGIQTYVGLALRDPALAAQLVCDGNFLGFVNGFVGDKHGEEAVHAMMGALVAYQACGLANTVVQELKNELDRFTLENFGNPTANLTADEVLNKSRTIPSWIPNVLWRDTFEPYRDYFREIADVPENLLKENLVKIIWLAGEAGKSLIGEAWTFYRIHENVKLILEALGTIPEITSRQKLMAVQVLTDLYLGNAFEAAKGSLEILQDGPLASCCFVQRYTNPYFSEEERQWIVDTILRCKYLDPSILRTPLNFSDEVHSLESVASIVTIVNTLGSLSIENQWVNAAELRTGDLAEDYYLGFDLATRLLRKRNPSLEWVSSVKERQHRKDRWQSFAKHYPKEKYYYYTEYDDETGQPMGEKQGSNEMIPLYQIGQRYPKSMENILRFLNAMATCDVPASFPNIPIVGANLSKLQFVKTSEGAHAYSLAATMTVSKRHAYCIGIGLLVESPYTFSNETYAVGTLSWLRNYNWLMHQLWPEGITEISITARHVFFDKNTKKLVEKEFNKLPPYEHTQWDRLSIDAELRGQSVNLKTLTRDRNAPNINFIPFVDSYGSGMAVIRSVGGYSVYIEEH
ncbi:MAG: hypothetical protein LBD69_00435 [Puniceicoccales bacterium]|jgi:hypothetical protein|nr:hypothetical protein [Puniceicoccales bacterium]